MPLEHEAILRHLFAGMIHHHPQGRLGEEAVHMQVLAAHGIDTMADCERGECGLCAVDVLALDGEIDHRDVFFSPEQKRDSRRLCACVSRVRGGGVVVDTGYRPDTAAPPVPTA